jgi:hypothetical protein
MFESKLNKGKPGGYAGLNISGEIYQNFIPTQLSSTINICSENLIGTGTIEEKIVQYLQLEGYTKSTNSEDVYIIVEDCGPLEVTLNVDIFSGSVIPVFTLIINRPLPQNVSLSAELTLGVLTGDSITTGATITIEEGNLSGQTTVVLSEVEYNNLSGVSNLLVGQLSVGYNYEVTANITFDIPIYNGSGSVGEGGVGFGIGLSNLD